MTTSPAQKRILVPDTSVLLPAYFPEPFLVDGKEFPLHHRAKRILNAIVLGEVFAFAPEILRFEFVQRASKFITGYGGSTRLAVEDVEEQIYEFFSLRLRWVAGSELDYDAWNLVRQHNLAPPDAYHLACARAYKGELWISHEHKDGFAEHARAVHNKVFTLTKDDFNVRV